MKSDTTMLKSILNGSKRVYSITHYIPEITFEGDDKKPDFGKMKISYVPSRDLIELKSLKYYFYQFRNKIFSYERFTNIVYDDIKFIYKPKYLKIEFETNPRGGISSKLEVEG